MISPAMCCTNSLQTRKTAVKSKHLLLFLSAPPLWHRYPFLESKQGVLMCGLQHFSWIWCQLMGYFLAIHDTQESPRRSVVTWAKFFGEHFKHPQFKCGKKWKLQHTWFLWYHKIRLSTSFYYENKMKLNPRQTVTKGTNLRKI